MSEEIWVPPGTSQAGTGEQKVFIVVAGHSGVGKSHTVRQLVEAYGKDEVVSFMAEDATATYGLPLPHIIRCKAIASAHAKMSEFVRGAAMKKRVPRIAVVDSLSGIVDYQQQEYNKTTPFRSSTSGERDKRAEFGDLGDQVRDFALLCRDEAPMDVVWYVTTAGNPPEYAVAGKIIPSNLTRWTSCTFYMKSVMREYERAEVERQGAEAQAPHRTIGFDGDKALVVNRVLVCMNTGEVLAKGHRNLGLIEKANLPEIIKKIKGEA